MRRWDVKQIHSPVLGWGRSTTNEASVNSIVFKILSGKWSPDHNRLWLLRRLAPTWEHFVQDIHPNFCTKATPTLHLKMGWKIATSPSAALVMISEGHIIKLLLYECCTSNKKTHAKCTSHQNTPKTVVTKFAPNNGPCTSGQSNASAGRKALANALLSSPGPKPWRSKGSWPKKHAMIPWCANDIRLASIGLVT